MKGRPQGTRRAIIEGKGKNMREEYDWSKGKKNPYAKQLKKQVTIKLSEDAIAYFKMQAKETGIPYQTLINLYLTDCARSGKRLAISWN
jgi:predicted DNA binding CopG/RHH family protein